MTVHQSERRLRRGRHQDRLPALSVAARPRQLADRHPGRRVPAGRHQLTQRQMDQRLETERATAWTPPRPSSRSATSTPASPPCQPARSSTPAPASAPTRAASRCSTWTCPAMPGLTGTRTLHQRRRRDHPGRRQRRRGRRRHGRAELRAAAGPLRAHAGPGGGQPVRLLDVDDQRAGHRRGRPGTGRAAGGVLLGRHVPGLQRHGRQSGDPMGGRPHAAEPCRTAGSPSTSAPR